VSLFMPIDILMPALSPTMEKGNLSRWLKKEGDKIKAGDVLAEIETDKATMEVEAVDEGVLAKIVIPGGTADVPVNNVIGLIAGEGEDAKSVAASGVPHLSTVEDYGTRSTVRAPQRRPWTRRQCRAPSHPPMVNAGRAFSPRRSRAGSPKNRGLTLPLSRARVRMAALSSVTSRLSLLAHRPRRTLKRRGRHPRRCRRPCPRTI
jgi:pyruvate dehydrogenase E2 component (dihydrolipoamide acetyltransferase)